MNNLLERYEKIESKIIRNRVKRFVENYDYNKYEDFSRREWDSLLSLLYDGVITELNMENYGIRF